MYKLTQKKVLVRITSVVGTFLICMSMNVSANAMTLGTVSGDTVNIRSGPSLEAEVIQQVEEGRAFEIVGFEDGWYQVKSAEVTETAETLTQTELVRNYWQNNYQVLGIPDIADGRLFSFPPKAERSDIQQLSEETTYYVNSGYLTLDVPEITVNDGLRLRLQPSTESRIIHQLSPDETVKILYTENEEWLYVEYAGTYRGYVSAEFVDLSSMNPDTLKMLDTVNQNRLSAVVKSDSLNVRLDTSTDSEIVGAFGYGDTIEVLHYEDGDEWIQIKTENDDVAYVSKEFVDLERTLTDEVDEKGYIKSVRIAMEAAAAEAAEAERNAATQREAGNRSQSKSSSSRTPSNNGSPSSNSNSSNSLPSFGSASATRSELVEWAKSWVGVCDYLYGGTNLSSGGGVDCSGFTQAVYKKFGISISRNSRTQFNDGIRINKSELQPGDLVFFGKGSIGHVGIYIGGDQMVNASSAKTGIIISSLSNHKNYVGAVRILD